MHGEPVPLALLLADQPAHEILHLRERVADALHLHLRARGIEDVLQLAARLEDGLADLLVADVNVHLQALRGARSHGVAHAEPVGAAVALERRAEGVVEPRLGVVPPLPHVLLRHRAVHDDVRPLVQLGQAVSIQLEGPFDEQVRVERLARADEDVHGRDDVLDEVLVEAALLPRAQINVDDVRRRPGQQQQQRPQRRSPPPWLSPRHACAGVPREPLQLRLSQP
mmetsp:Transcript_29029/g.92884  ORF Transcript_29029/g.92884 Transcript_29029/m.92884 type:complete len:225 (+) Transcript_29029:548-1222(+)